MAKSKPKPNPTNRLSCHKAASLSLSPHLVQSPFCYLPAVILPVLLTFTTTGTPFLLSLILMDIFDSCLNPEQPDQPPKPEFQNNNNNVLNEDDDIFGSSINLEESHIKEGHNDGYKVGLNLGNQEGYEVGLKHGFESGEELGFYRGLIDVWNFVIRVKPDYFPARVQKSIHQIQELLEKYPFMDHDDESKDDILNQLRLKFRVVSASLGVKFEYKGYPKMSDDHDF